MRYLLATRTATDAVMLISEPSHLPGHGPGRAVAVPCWAGCPVGTSHDLAELPSLAAVDALEAETEKAQRAAVESAAGVRTPETPPEAPHDPSQPREPGIPDRPPGAGDGHERMSCGAPISSPGGAQ